MFEVPVKYVETLMVEMVDNLAGSSYSVFFLSVKSVKPLKCKDYMDG